MWKCEFWGAQDDLASGMKSEKGWSSGMVFHLFKFTEIYELWRMKRILWKRRMWSYDGESLFNTRSVQIVFKGMGCVGKGCGGEF